MPIFLEKVEFEDVEVVFVSDAGGVLCKIEGEDVWIPQSQIDDDSECWRAGDEGKLVISEWIANQKGLI